MYVPPEVEECLAVSIEVPEEFASRLEVSVDRYWSSRGGGVFGRKYWSDRGVFLAV